MASTETQLADHHARIERLEQDVSAIPELIGKHEVRVDRRFSEQLATVNDVKECTRRIEMATAKQSGILKGKRLVWALIGSLVAALAITALGSYVGTVAAVRAAVEADHK